MPPKRRGRSSHHPCRLSSRKKAPFRKGFPTVTSGEILANGYILELVTDADTGELRLLLCNGSFSKVAPLVEFQSEKFVPPDVSPSVVRAITLPKKFKLYGSTTDLFASLCDCLLKCGILDEVAHRVTYFVLSTQFSDVLPFAPCLTITGPRPESIFLLQLLGCVVRHALPLGPLTREGFCSLPMGLSPTLLVDATKLSPSTLSLLAAPNCHACYLPIKNAFADFYCSKALYLGPIHADDVFENHGLHVNLAPSHERLPALSARSSCNKSRTSFNPNSSPTDAQMC